MSSSFVDDTFHLDATTRARIAPTFDADALERLFQRLDPRTRAAVLDEFLRPEFRRTAPPPNQVRFLSGFANPLLNELLAEVWQPFWDAQPVEMLEDVHSPYPGRELALRRRGRQP